MGHVHEMADEQHFSISKTEDPNLTDYIDRAFAAHSRLFEATRQVDEIQFAMCLFQEMRGMREGGWSTADEARTAFSQYIEHMKGLEPTDPMAVRISLSLYSYLSESAGVYETTKNMLRIVSGQFHHIMPFSELVELHKITGERIAPNANRIMKDILGHAATAGHGDLGETILEAFDADLRNGYAHADYVVSSEGIRLPRRNGGQYRVVDYQTFATLLNKAVYFFEVLNRLVQEAMASYTEPRLVHGRINGQDPAMWAVIRREGNRFGFKMGGDIGPETDPHTVKF